VQTRAVVIGSRSLLSATELNANLVDSTRAVAGRRTDANGFPIHHCAVAGRAGPADNTTSPDPGTLTGAPGLASDRRERKGRGHRADVASSIHTPRSPGCRDRVWEGMRNRHLSGPHPLRAGALRAQNSKRAERQLSACPRGGPADLTNFTKSAPVRHAKPARRGRGWHRVLQTPNTTPLHRCRRPPPPSTSRSPLTPESRASVFAVSTQSASGSITVRADEISAPVRAADRRPEQLRCAQSRATVPSLLKP